MLLKCCCLTNRYIVLVLDATEDNDEPLEDYSPALPQNLEHVPLDFKKLPLSVSLERSAEFYELMNKRRTVRHFSKEKVPAELIYNIIKTAGMYLCPLQTPFFNEF